MFDDEILESDWLIGWGFLGCDWLVDLGFLMRFFLIVGSPRADLAVAAPQSLPWFALWRCSDRDVAKRHGVVADAR